MPDPTYDRAKLRRDAETRCTPGRDGHWEYDASEQMVREPAQGFVIARHLYHVDGVHIANMDPPTTLALLDELDQAETALSDVLDELDGAVGRTPGDGAKIDSAMDIARAALPTEESK